MAMALELGIAPAETAATSSTSAAAAAARRRKGWLLRRMYSLVAGDDQATVPRTAQADAAPTSTVGGGAGAGAEKGRARRPGWLRRLASREYALGRRWKLSGASSRLAAGLRWKRLSGRFSVAGGLGGGGCASAVLDTVAFRVMYVVEAVVLGLALSCFFCCCGCQI